MDHIYVAPCGEIGLGLFAAQDIPKGTVILTFTGRIVEADDPMHRTEEAGKLVQIDDRLYLYPDQPAVFANHSCTPNAGIKQTTKLTALRDIAADEQICFDYSTTMDEDDWTMECACGAANCRGLIKDFKYLPQELREKYLALRVVQPFIARKATVGQGQ